MENPRIVLTSSNDELGLSSGKIFLGYVKSKDQIEVISYNDEAGRFEFQVVLDYSTKPKVFYVNRGKCLTCHQGHAPIFSGPQWEDTSQGVMGDLISAQLQLEGSPSQNRKRAAEILFGNLPSRDRATIFDKRVRESNMISLQERFWAFACGEDAKCRAGLLLQALSPEASQTEEYFEHTERALNNSDVKNQNFYDSVLSSSDLGVRAAISKYGMANFLKNRLFEIISNLYRLNPFDNPATLRTRSLALRNLAVKQLQTFSPVDLENLKQAYGNDQFLGNVIERLYLEKNEMFAQGAINRFLVMHTLLAEVGSPLADNYSKWIEKKTPMKRLLRSDTIPVFQSFELNVFSRYCSECHSSEIEFFPIQFLSGNEQEVIDTMKASVDEISFVLEEKHMPPSRKLQRILSESGDLKIMMDYLNSLGSQ